MKSIRRYYDHVAEELEPTPAGVALPSRIHAIVPVSQLNEPTLRALAFARATRPSTLTAVVVEVDPEDTAALVEAWNKRQIPVPLAVIDSPYREFTTPLLSYIADIRRQSPRDVVCVFIPEYVVTHWWQQLLHNQSALRLKGRLLFTPGRHGDQRAVPPEPPNSASPSRLDRPPQLGSWPAAPRGWSRSRVIPAEDVEQSVEFIAGLVVAGV